jgi:hypothetical protein
MVGKRIKEDSVKVAIVTLCDLVAETSRGAFGWHSSTGVVKRHGPSSRIKGKVEGI